MNTRTFRTNANLPGWLGRLALASASGVNSAPKAVAQVLRIALAVAIAHFGVASAQELNQELKTAEREQLIAGMEGTARALSIAMGDASKRGALIRRFAATPRRRLVALSDVAAESAAMANLGRVGLGRFVLRLPSQDKLTAMSATLGARDVYVAVDPLRDEADVRTITAFSGGRRTELDARLEPIDPVFVIGLAESETLDPAYPLPTTTTPEDETGPLSQVNDFVGIHQMLITNDHEPWYKFAPEIVVKVRRTNILGGIQNLFQPLPSVDKTNRWYSLGDPNSTYISFDSLWHSNYELVVWEQDLPNDADDLVGHFIVNWRALPYGGYTERSKGDVRIRLDRD